jgi:hypothetical protein
MDSNAELSDGLFLTPSYPTDSDPYIYHDWLLKLPPFLTTQTHIPHKIFYLRPATPLAKRRRGGPCAPPTPTRPAVLWEPPDHTARPRAPAVNTNTDHVTGSVASTSKVQADDGSWIPSTYRDFRDIFSKKEAQTLPPTDHTIDLEPGTKLPYRQFTANSKLS